MQSRSVKLFYNWLIHNMTYTSTLHNDILSIKKFMQSFT